LLTKYPWDWSKLRSSINDGIIEFNGSDIINEINGDTLELAKIKFNIGSVVYEKVTAREIIDGFEELKTFFDFVRVLEVLSNAMLAKIRKILDPSPVEPDTIDLLKLCYWYNRLKNINTIEHKRKEIFSRVCQRLLHRLEKRSKRTIDYSNLSEYEIKEKIDNTLDEIRQTQSTDDSMQTFRWLNEYLNFINVCVSELIFPSLASESGSKIDFVPTNKDHDYDYDIMINGHPTQIKTLFSYEVFGIDEVEQHKQEKYHQGVARVRELYDTNQITMDLVKKEIIEFTKRSCINKINDALRQKAEIIIIDSTRTIPGLLQNYYYTNDTEYIKFHNSLTEVMNNPINKFVYVIFASTAYDNKFRVSSLVVKVPVTKINQVIQVDNSKKDEIFI
jgi:hypothetical protein